MRPIVIGWAGGEHSFALPLGGLRAVQTACDAGPMQIHQQLSLGLWRVDHLVAVIRHGLEGGGMPADEAKRLTNAMFDLHPLAAFVPTAALVMAHAVLGPPDDSAPEQDGAEGKVDGVALPPSMESGASASST